VSEGFLQLRSIQVLRAVAAISVLILHATMKNGPTFELGAAGVDLFFVISGFIMATVASTGTASDFLRRRFLRIYPIWWVAVFARLILVNHTDVTAPRLLASVTLWPVWGDYVVPVPPLGWTLSFEMLFYLGLTLALLTRPLFPLAIFGLCLLGSTVSEAPVFDFIGSPMVFEFLFGFSIAKLPHVNRFGILLIALGVGALAVAPLHADNARVLAMDAQLAPLRVFFWGLPCALIMYGAVSLETHFRDAGWNIAVLLGDASYSIYLFHLIPIATLDVAWWLSAILAIVFGLLAYLAIERPLLLLARSWTRTRSAQTRAAHGIIDRVE